MARRFVTLDVFTEQRLAGNPLAVVLDADRPARHRRHAGHRREFNLSETVFVLPPAEARHRARLRIFTPRPGAAVRRPPHRGDRDPAGCWRTPPEGRLPAPSGWRRGSGSSPAWPSAGRTGAAARRGSGCRCCPIIAAPGRSRDPGAAHRIEPRRSRHRPARSSRHEVGPSFTCVPVASVAALDAARPAQAPDAEDGLCLYARSRRIGSELRRVRMFAPNFGVPEDPATGAAASAFAGVLMQFEALGDGTHDVAIRQGEAMGRPSEIALQLTIESGTLRGGDRRRRRDRVGWNAACLRRLPAHPPHRRDRPIRGLRLGLPPRERGGDRRALARPDPPQPRHVRRDRAAELRPRGRGGARPARPVRDALSPPSRPTGISDTPTTGSPTPSRRSCPGPRTAPCWWARWAPTANAGQLYFPCGTPDPDDVRGARVDLAGSAAEELTEETGSRAAGGADTAWVLLEGENQLAFLRPVRFPDPAAALVAHQRAPSPARGQSRNSPGSASCGARPTSMSRRMPGFVQAYLRHAFDPA
ncbi:PhzF family phenazine biosynthesis protein [Methylobacterium oryzae CBMB20]